MSKIMVMDGDVNILQLVNVTLSGMDGRDICSDIKK